MLIRVRRGWFVFDCRVISWFDWNRRCRLIDYRCRCGDRFVFRLRLVDRNKVR